MTEPSAASSVDALWEQLAPHVEWPEGFSLVFLFAGHPRPVGELRDKLAQSVQQRAKTLKILEPETAQAVAELTPSVIMAPGAECGAMWISLLRRAGTQAWTIAVRELLQRLNERRFLLERDVAVPVVIVLPLELRSEAYVLAPDLWTVRSFTAQVPASALQGLVETIDDRTSILQRVLQHGAAKLALEVEPREPIHGDRGGRAEVEWARLLATGDLRRISTADGFAAQDSALARGDLPAARRLLMQTLAVALEHVGIEVETRDDFDVLEALGTKEIDDARAQWEIAAGLERLSLMEDARKNPDVARKLFHRALVLREALAAEEPIDGRAQRALAASLRRLGTLQMEAGELDAAHATLLRAAERGEVLAEASPADQQLRHEVAETWFTLVDLETRREHPEAARAHLQRYQAILESQGADPYDEPTHTSLILHWLVLGVMEKVAGNLAGAREALQRNIALLEPWIAHHPHDRTKQSLLVTNLRILGAVEREADDLTTARELLERACVILQALALATPTDAKARFEVAGVHRDLADLARHQQDHVAEREHLRHAADVLDAMEASGQLSGDDERERLREDVSGRLASLATG